MSFSLFPPSPLPQAVRDICIVTAMEGEECARGSIHEDYEPASKGL